MIRQRVSANRVEAKALAPKVIHHKGQFFECLFIIAAIQPTKRNESIRKALHSLPQALINPRVGSREIEQWSHDD